MKIFGVDIDPGLAILAAIVGLIGLGFTFLGLKFQERARLQSYFSELRNWADAALHDESEALHLCMLDPATTEEPSFYNRRHDLLVRLSARIDQGRWFFPNTHHTEIGEWKPEAFRGIRDKPLDALVYFYNAVKAMNYKDKSKNDHLWEYMADTKRQFTSDIQKILDPRSAHEQFGIAMNARESNDT